VKIQGAKEFRFLVDEASSRYPKEEYPSLYRMIVYLGALFDAMDKEQSKLLETEDIDSLFETVRQAELVLRGKTKLDADTAEATYSHALENLEDLANVTKLLDTLLCNLYEKRAAVRALAQKWDGSLEDIETCLTKFEPSQDMTIRLQTQRAHALQALGRVVEAKEAIGKAILVNPQSEELQKKLRQLNLQ
jgi:tetratricopeptide (TPR) repeat protein